MVGSPGMDTGVIVFSRINMVHRGNHRKDTDISTNSARYDQRSTKGTLIVMARQVKDILLWKDIVLIYKGCSKAVAKEN